MNRLRKLIFVVVLVLAPSLFASMSALAEAYTEGENTTIQIDANLFVPCAAGGAGEDVHLTGALHDMTHVTIDNTGGFHIMTLSQPMGVKGVGLTTGDNYQGTGAQVESFNGSVGETYTLVYNFRIIGQGKGNNFILHETRHATVNANGEATSQVDNLTSDCK
jgi:hypothetical protein